MEPSYVGAIWMFGGNFAPRGFAFCNGSLQSIAENEVLYVLLGTTYGGDGVQTFGLPDLRGRVALSQGQGPGLSNYVLGQMSGTEQVSLTANNMASHTHLLNVGTSATTATPASNLYFNQLTAGGTAQTVYSDAAPNSTISLAGSNIPFNIVQPITTISYVISLFGIFPSQN